MVTKNKSLNLILILIFSIAYIGHVKSDSKDDVGEIIVQFEVNTKITEIIFRKKVIKYFNKISAVVDKEFSYDPLTVKSDRRILIYLPKRLPYKEVQIIADLLKKEPNVKYAELNHRVYPM